MFRDADWLKKSGNTPINPEEQKRVVREEAGNFLTNLKDIENGEQLVEVVTAFANVARSYLKYRNSKNEEKEEPYLTSRIEPHEEFQSKLSSEAKKIYTELLRYSLFIEDPRGKSIRGNVVSRLYLRRCLLPNFNLTFGNRDSIRLECREIEELFLNPKEFEKKKTQSDKSETDSKQKTFHFNEE